MFFSVNCMYLLIHWISCLYSALSLSFVEQSSEMAVLRTVVSYLDFIALHVSIIITARAIHINMLKYFHQTIAQNATSGSVQNLWEGRRHDLKEAYFAIVWQNGECLELTEHEGWKQKRDFAEEWFETVLSLWILVTFQIFCNWLKSKLSAAVLFQRDQHNKCFIAKPFDKQRYIEFNFKLFTWRKKSLFSIIFYSSFI